MPARHIKSDLDLLQGSWSVISLETDGNRMDASMLTGAKIVIQGDRFQSLGMGAEYEGILTLDPAAKPKAFDLKFTKGEAKGKTNLGIYQLDGDDWKICLNTLGGDRPKKFATRGSFGLALESLKRGEPAPQETKPKKQKHAPTGPPTELEGEWQLVSGSLNGKPMDAVSVQWSRRKFAGNVATYLTGPQVLMQANFTLDRARQHMDSDHIAGMYKGKKQLAIYEFKGDALKISAATPGNSRPGDFEPAADRNVTVWKRL